MVLEVVMDRCFASTLAYGAAAQATIASSDDVPTRRPDHVIFLSLPEAERRRRLAARAEQFTDEERRLSSDHPFRERVIAGYRALGCRFVDASRARRRDRANGAGDRALIAHQPAVRR